MEFSNVDLNNILDKKCDELEIKFKVSSEIIFKLLNTLKNPVITFSVSLIDGSLRRESFYSPETLKKTHHEDILKTIDFNSKIKLAKLVCSSEKPVNYFDPKKTQQIRIKKRYSFNESKYVRLDFTFIKNLDPKTSKLPEIINNFFKEDSKDNLELEAEFLVDFFKLSVEEKKSIINKTTEKILIDLGFEKKSENILNPINSYLNSIGVLKRSVETVKQITNNPKLFSKDIYEKKFNPGDFLVMEKSDGLRCLLKLEPNKFTEIIEGSQVSFSIKTEMPSGTYHLIDCEKKNGEYLAFDIIIFQSTYIKINYLERLEKLRIIEKSGIFKIKEILPVTCENMMKLSSGNDVDGLIFQEIAGDYYKALILKWKPINLLTFDFLIVPLPYIGVNPFVLSNNQNKLYLLMTGCAKEKTSLIKFPGFYQKLMTHHNIVLSAYNPVPFTPPLEPLSYIWESGNTYNLSVGEFNYNIVSKKWNLVKIREDKSLLISKRIFGNDFSVAEAQFNELHNPLTLELLCNIKQGGSDLLKDKIVYFQNQKDMEYAKMTKFNNYVKFKIMCTIKGMQRILDIASGRGADVFIYNGLEVGHVSFVEPDKTAFIELSRRVKLLGEAKFYTHTPLPKKNMKFDLTNEDYDTFAEHCKGKYNALVCNFAAHYFLKNRNDYIAFNKFCATNKIEIVILLILDSEILEKFMVNNEYKNDKYYIRAEGDKLLVKHHFASELIEECKINTPILIKSMKNYEIVKRDSFGAYAKEYEQNKKIILNELDLEYSSFYQYLVFRMN